MTIKHHGIVDHIAEGRVVVRIEQQSACAACHAKGICGESGQTKFIPVDTPYASDYEVGERVVVALERGSMAFSSVLWGYLYPLVVLLVALFAVKHLSGDDGIAALGSLVAVALYYVLLYLMRRMFDRKIKFTITKE